MSKAHFVPAAYELVSYLTKVPYIDSHIVNLSGSDLRRKIAKGLLNGYWLTFFEWMG